MSGGVSGLTRVLAGPNSRDNAGMSFFYWFMAVIMAGTLLPSALYMGVYVFTGADEALVRARKFWNFLRVFTLLAFNITVWGNVVVGLWGLIR